MTSFSCKYLNYYIESIIIYQTVYFPPKYSKYKFRHFSCLFNPASEASRVVLNLTGGLLVIFKCTMIKKENLRSLSDHRRKSLFLVPDLSLWVKNVLLGRAKKMHGKKGKKSFLRSEICLTKTP